MRTLLKNNLIDKQLDMADIRLYQAYLSIACTGPAYSSKIEYLPRTEVPRGAADIKLTTADIDYFSNFWRQDHYDGGIYKIHRRLQNPSGEEFKVAIREIDDWFSSHKEKADFDGGCINITFAGHGRRGTGNLVLKDIDVDVNQLVDTILSFKKSDRDIRVSLILDSCFSGAFLISFFQFIAENHWDDINLDYLAAACLHDEAAKESAQLGHGYFTYCFSCRPENLGTITAQAVQPDNTMGPSLSIASGALGCSILTKGTQNPIIIEEKDYLVSCLGEKFKLIDENFNLLDVDNVISEIEGLRDRLKYSLRMIDPMTTRADKARTLEQIRQDIDVYYNAIKSIYDKE